MGQAKSKDAGDVSFPVASGAKKTAAEKQAREDNREYRVRVFREMLETETTYVEDLTILVEVFLDPLQTQKLLPPADLKVVCSNASIIQHLHRQFLADLTLCSAKLPTPAAGGSALPELVVEGLSAQILETFERMYGFLKMYGAYCSSYPPAVKIIKARSKSNSAFRSFLAAAQKNPRTRGLDFTSFLIKPPQRLCKYPLFFRDLLKHVDRGWKEDEQLYDRILALKERVESVGATVNSNVGKEQSGEQLMHVYCRLTAGPRVGEAVLAEVLSQPRTYIGEYVDEHL